MEDLKWKTLTNFNWGINSFISYKQTFWMKIMQKMLRNNFWFIKKAILENRPKGSKEAAKAGQLEHQ